MKVTMHVGAQKTGSTVLQQWFIRNEQALQEAGIAFPKRLILKNNVDPIHRMITRLDRHDRGEAEVIAFRDRLKEISHETGCDHIVVSHDNALGRPFSPADGTFFPMLEQRVAFFQRVFEDPSLEVEFALFIRDLADYLRSFYVQDVRQGGTKELSQFVQQCDLESMSWRRLADELTTAFPTRVKIAPYESFFRAPAVNLNALFFAGTLDETLCAQIKTMKANQSPPSLAVNIARILNNIIRNRTDKTRRQAGYISTKYVMAPFQILPRSLSSHLSIDQAPELRSRYEAELLALGPLISADPGSQFAP